MIKNSYSFSFYSPLLICLHDLVLHVHISFGVLHFHFDKVSPSIDFLSPLVPVACAFQGCLFTGLGLAGLLIFTRILLLLRRTNSLVQIHEFVSCFIVVLVGLSCQFSSILGSGYKLCESVLLSHILIIGVLFHKCTVSSLTIL